MSERERAAWTALRSVLTHRAFLPATLGVAAALRLAHVFALVDTVWFSNLLLDPGAYNRWALKIAGGSWLGSEVFYQDPLYPYFLAVCYSAGLNLLGIRLVQVAMGVGTCALVGFAGRRCFGKAVGNGAALLAALYIPSIFYEGEIEKTFLATFLLAAVVALLCARRSVATIGAGFALALACLVRGNLLLLFPLFALHAWALPLRAGDAPGKARVVARGAALLLVGFVAGLAPVTLRNEIVGGEWVLTTAQLGQNFYTGNHAGNDTGSYLPPPFVRPDPQFERIDFQREAESRLGRPLSASEVSRYWLRQGLRQVEEEPLRWLRRTVRKLMLCVLDYEVADNQSLYFLALSSPVLRVPLPTFGWIFPFAVIGAWASIGAWHGGRRSRPAAGHALLVAAYIASLLPFFVYSRYRAPLVVSLFPLAALGLRSLLYQLREREWLPMAVSCVAVGLLAMLCFMGPRRDVNFAQSYTNLASLHRWLGDDAAARVDLSRALEIDPGQPVALREWATLDLEGGRPVEAERRARAAVAADPTRPDSWWVLARAEAELGDWSSARQSLQRAHRLRSGDLAIALDLARAEIETGDLEAGRARLLQLRRVAPEMGEVHRLLVGLELSRGNGEAAQQAVQAARRAGVALPSELLRQVREASR